MSYLTVTVRALSGLLQTIATILAIALAMQGHAQADAALEAEVGNWMTTGSLAMARQGHTATLLPNGRVLVVGGLGAGGSAELFDPASGTWSTAAAPRGNRRYHTATLLLDGRVLVAGGGYLGSYTETAEVFDPTSGTWTDTGSMGEQRGFHGASLLQDGSVLIAGGDGPLSRFGRSLDSAEIYDPARGTWRQTGRLQVERADPSMTLLPSGKVLTAGGYDDFFLPQVTQTTEWYDPATGGWTTLPDLPKAVVGHSATLLSDGKVLVAGGYDGTYSFDLAALFDPVTRAWNGAGTLKVPRGFHTATMLGDGEILLAGGFKLRGPFDPSPEFEGAELYAPESRSFRYTGNMFVERQHHTATLLADGRVLIAGGRRVRTGTTLRSAEIYTPAGFVGDNYTGVWFDPAQDGHGLFVEHLGDGRIVASWYTFAPDGRQTWLIGVGTLSGNRVTMDVLLTRNGHFPPAFVASNVVRTNFGQMTLRFDSCEEGLLSFAFPAPFGSGTMPLRRPERPAGIACSSSTDLMTAGSGPQPNATGPAAALTGTWANPNQSGHGFQMEVLSGDRLVLSWYVFDETGEQMWLIGAGPISDQSAAVAMVRTAGGRFIPNFDPAVVTRPTVGTVTVTALSCVTARVDYVFDPPFGSGSIPITRVTSVRGALCTL